MDKCNCIGSAKEISSGTLTTRVAGQFIRDLLVHSNVT